MKRCSKSPFSRAARIWLAAYLLVWALSCAWVWLFGVAPVYLMLFFGLFQFLVFPVLLFGTGAALGLCAAPGPLRWALPALLGLLYSIWPLNMLLAARPAGPELSFVLFGCAAGYLGLAAGTAGRAPRGRK